MRATFCKHLIGKMNCPVCANENNLAEQETMFWEDFSNRLAWTVRYKSLLIKQSVHDSMLEASRIFYELKGRRPHYGSEMYKFVASSNKVLKEADSWLPDPLEIWQEQEYHGMLKPIFDEMIIVLETDEIDKKLELDSRRFNHMMQGPIEEGTDSDEDCLACGA